MDIRFDGKVAIVTGAAGGIGSVCAEMLAESGAKVALADIRMELVAEMEEKLKDKGFVKGYRLDLTKVSDIERTVERIRKEMGEIDVLVQPAAVAGPSSSADLSEEVWDSLFSVNAKGLFFMMREVAKQSMIPRKTGAIVNFASIAGLVGMRPPLSSPHYSASKGAVIALTRQTAIEWGGHGIRVNAVAPGGVLTEMTVSLIGDKLDCATALVPLRKLTKPEEVAAAVLFLASDMSGNTTGQVLVIDGGGYSSQADPSVLPPGALEAYSR